MPIQDKEQSPDPANRLELEQERRWGTSRELFRQQALEHYHRRQPIEGRLLRLSPRWLPLTYGLLLAMMVAFLMFCALVRIGEFAEAPAVVVDSGSGGTTIAALFSVQDRPRLEIGMPMRLEITGYGHLQLEPRIAGFEDQPSTKEAQSGVVEAGVVRATARLPADSFTFGGETLRYAPGMAARARVRLSDEPILVALVPALKRWWPEASDTNSASDTDG